MPTEPPEAWYTTIPHKTRWRVAHHLSHDHGSSQTARARLTQGVRHKPPTLLLYLWGNHPKTGWFPVCLQPQSCEWSCHGDGILVQAAAAGANQRSSASANPSISPASPAQAMHPSGRISIDGPASAGKQRTRVKPAARPAARPSGDASSTMPSPCAISANSDVRTSASPTGRSPVRRPTTSRSEPRS